MAFAVTIGLASARFLGTSSPKIMVAKVPKSSPVAAAIGVTHPDGTPSRSSGPSMRSETEGSARKPIARLVTVIPTWAPDSWVERLRSARWSPCAPESPAAASCSTWARSTVTKENSAATKTPHAATSASASTSSNREVVTVRLSLAGAGTGRSGG